MEPTDILRSLAIYDAQTVREALSLAKKASEENLGEAVRQLYKFIQSVVLRHLLDNPIGVVDDGELGVGIVDIIDWIGDMESKEMEPVKIRLITLLDLMEDARAVASVAKEMLILANPRARQLLVDFHNGKIKPFQGSRGNRRKIELLERLQAYGLISLSAFRGKRGVVRYSPIATTARGAQLVKVIEDIEQTAPR